MNGLLISAIRPEVGGENELIHPRTGSESGIDIQFPYWPWDQKAIGIPCSITQCYIIMVTDGWGTTEALHFTSQSQSTRERMWRTHATISVTIGYVFSIMYE